MPASEAISGYETGFEVETAAGSGVYFELGEVSSITPPNESTDSIEVTHLKSPNRTKEFLQGFVDPGDMTLELNHIPGSDTDDFILAWRTSGETRSCRITYPTAVTDTFPGFVTGYAPGGITHNDKLGATLTLKVAGAVIRA